LPAGLLILLLTLGAHLARAGVDATLDRDRVALGDTVRLTITATDNEDLGDAELAPLQRDFDILQRSSSSNTSIVNGRLSQSRQVVLELAPRREGRLQVPALRVGEGITPAISLVVGPAPDIKDGGETVLFEAEVDRQQVYVQGQLILTLRVQQAINLDNRSIEEFKLDNVFIKPLEQRSFQRSAGGRQWLVHEVRYALFPEKSGTLEIPVQVFTGRIPPARRSLFDLGQGKLVRRTTQALTVDVLPQPAGLNTDTWLPVRDLSVEESWSTPPDELRVGESATRTITIKGEGAQGAQLPPIRFSPIDGLKYYPDQPEISEEEIAGGLLGIRKDSAAVVPTRAGTYRIPEIRIPWWDTQAEQLRYAVIPERQITVAASATASGEPGPTPTANIATNTMPNAPAPPPTGGDRTWQAIALLSTTGWLLTLVYLWRQRRRSPAAATEDSGASEGKAFRQLLASCAGGDAASVRNAVVTWGSALRPDSPPVSLAQVADMFRDETLSGELDRLDASLYSRGGESWSGAALAECLRRLRRTRNAKGNRDERPLELYPESN